MAFVNVEFLRQNGPSVGKALPCELSAAQRAAGVHTFKISGARGQSSGSMGGQITPVYYLDEHDVETVLRAFCDANLALLDTKSKTGFIRSVGQHGRTWREVAREIADEFGLEVRGNPEENGAEGEWGYGKPCPLCGVDIEGTLPEHLRQSCERN